ncbi:MAG: hypothetical protein RL693_476 [Verrucomicrobiota bacterium]
MNNPSAPVLILCFIGTLALSNCTTSIRQGQESETAQEGLTVLDKAALNLSDGPVSFERQVKPILESKCFACHSGDAAAAGFSVESRTFAMTRGASAQRIVPGKPEASRFLALAGTHQNVASMPPVGYRLTTAESKILWRWVAEGAPWPEGKAGVLHESTKNLFPEHSAH